MKRKYINCLTVLFFFLLISGNTFAQVAKCGTIITPQQVAKEQAIPDTGQFTIQFAPDYCLNKTLSITAHIISDSLGNYGLAEADILGSIATLNTWFEPICLSFEVCQFNYIPNYKYFRFEKPRDEAELIALYSVTNTINIYYPLTVSRIPPLLVAGYAYFPGGEDFIVISAQSLGAVTHEMGHFFGLYHTFETQYGNELANGSNCATAGDLICDTPADPGASNTAPPDCQLLPYTQDINGDWFVPHIGNIMSYYSDDCVCGFTTQQYNRMASNYLSSRFYLW